MAVILICTPIPLLRLIEDHLLQFSKAQSWFLMTLMHRYICSKRKSSGFFARLRPFCQGQVIAIQTLSFAEKWTTSVNWFHSVFQNCPMLIFGSFLRLRLQFRVNSHVHYCQHEYDRVAMVAQIVKKFVSTQKLQSSAQVQRECSFLVAELNKKYGILSISLDSSAPHYEQSS